MKAILSLIFLIASFTIEAQTIDTLKSIVRFKVGNMGINKVKGTFKGMEGTVVFKQKDLKSSAFQVCIDATTLNTKNSLRDKHLRYKDFFDTDTYPTICFQSSEIKQENGSKYIVRGKLTIRDVTKEVSIPFTYENNTFLGEFTINRKDYNVGKGSTIMVGNEVALIIECTIK